MRIRTDYEGVNLSTGTKVRYIVGEGSRLTEREAEAVRVFERAMKEVAIPQMLREIRAREKSWNEISTMILD